MDPFLIYKQYHFEKAAGKAAFFIQQYKYYLQLNNTYLKLKVGECFLCGFAPLRSLRETYGQFSKPNWYDS